MNHTPGPWRIADPAHRCLIVAGEHGLHIAQAATTGMPNCEANAKLIAMAPQLFDALCRVTHPMADDTDVDHALDLIAQLTEQP